MPEGPTHVLRACISREFDVKSMGQRSFASNPWLVDVLCIALVVALNPITYLIDLSTLRFTPDTVAYATMGRDLFTKGLLYISGWGHVDNGLILPPLYPFFIACGQFFWKEPLNVAEWVSDICALLTAFPIYLYLKETTNRTAAVLTVFLMEVNYYYVAIGMQPLSEATFLLFLSCCLFLTLRLFGNRKTAVKGLPILVGASSGLVFLSRQVGILIFFVLALLSLLQGLSASPPGRRVVIRNFVLISLGWAMVFAPYTTLLYMQTGQHPFKQKFQEHSYQVRTLDPVVLSKISKIKGLKIAQVQQLENASDQEYGIIYAKRRFLRELLPDASEMLAFLKTGEKEKSLVSTAFSSILGKPVHYASTLYQNTVHLGQTLGNALLVLFLVCCISPFLLKSERRTVISRLILPIFIASYLLAISCFTDTIPRYIYILFPFALIHIIGEVLIGFDSLIRFYRLNPPKLLLFSLLYGSALFVTPRYYNDLKLFPKLEGAKSEFQDMRKHIKGDPVFGLSPLYTYLSGGSYRLLPNDSLKKVVIYAKKTGVHWLLITFTEDARSELTFYSNVNWYWRPSLEEDYPGLVRYCCSTDDHMMALYKIL